MFAAVRRIIRDIVQVIRLHSAFGKGNMRVHSLRRTATGQYLVRVSLPQGRAINTQQRPNLGVYNLSPRLTGSHTQLANDKAFIEYYAEAMALDDAENVDNVELTVYGADYQLATSNNADRGLVALLRDFGCDIGEAEIIQDGGYGSQWLSVAFNAA